MRILVIEDEKKTAGFLAKGLREAGFAVEIARDGETGLEKARAAKFDLLIVDIMLPNKDGYAIAKSIRQNNTATPIIFVTAKKQTEDLVRGFDQGGNDYLRKPFSMEELIVRINNLLQITRKPTAASQDVIEIGKYEFLPGRYELKISGETKKLSHREAMLLQILCDHKNANVTRKDVLMYVWGDDSFFNSRNLDVYVTKLREYLKKDPAIEIITIKGVGYHFSVG